MTTEGYLEEWRHAGLITAAQHAALVALVRKQRFSVYLELNALLYVAAVAIAGGVAWTVRPHFASLGDAVIVASLSKPYLGLRRESWDPILFGALLVVTATVVRRWLARGRGGQRRGFTAEKILERDSDWLRTVATASVAWPHDPGAARPPEPAPSRFEGGRSGGGGGGAQY